MCRSIEVDSQDMTIFEIHVKIHSKNKTALLDPRPQLEGS